MTQDEEDAWCLARRAQVIDYLMGQDGLNHGRIGDWPAWFVAPCVSVWAIESVIAPESVGWWVICGDLPTDYCSAHECRHPRLAIKRIADRWRDAINDTKPGSETIGAIGISASLKSLLEKRVELLHSIATDDSAWLD
jgi:hypothetical protein